MGVISIPPCVLDLSLTYAKGKVNETLRHIPLAFPGHIRYNHPKINPNIRRDFLWKTKTWNRKKASLTLTDENGQDMDFEYLDCLTYEGKEYLVLMPADEPSTEIVILEVEPVDEENENYLAVEDEAILDAVYGLFKEKYKDILTFEED